MKENNMFGFRKNKNKPAAGNPDEIILHAPADGELIALEDVKDPVFAQKMMGEGFAVVPESGLIVSPVDGVVVLTAPTAHAVGLESQGVSILVHCGLDTVNLNGDGLELLVREGQTVHAGDPLVRYDQKKMHDKGIYMTTPVVITDAGGFVFEAPVPDEVSAGDRAGRLHK